MPPQVVAKVIPAKGERQTIFEEREKSYKPS